MALIIETGLITAAKTDLLAAPSRLAAIPYNGNLQFEISSSACTATSYAQLTIQLPDGEVPIDNQIIPASGEGTGVLWTETAFKFAFPAFQGGHFLISVTPAGSPNLIWRAALRSR